MRLTKSERSLLWRLALTGFLLPPLWAVLVAVACEIYSDHAKLIRSRSNR